jgi:hypothetical protein
VRARVGVAHLPVRGVVAAGRRRSQGRGLTGEALGDGLVDGAVPPGVGLLPEPLLCKLIEVGPALERAVPGEEVVLEVVDIALVLALGLGAGRPTGPRAEAVVAGQVEASSPWPPYRGLRVLGSIVGPLNRNRSLSLADGSR